MSNMKLIDLIDIDICALHDAWNAAPDPNAAIWFKLWALVAIEAGLPFYGDGNADLGAAGWAQWLAEALQSVTPALAPEPARKADHPPARGREQIRAWMNFVRSPLAKQVRFAGGQSDG